jgi:hypothetical protein
MDADDKGHLNVLRSSGLFVTCRKLYMTDVAIETWRKEVGGSKFSF